MSAEEIAKSIQEIVDRSPEMKEIRDLIIAFGTMRFEEGKIEGVKIQHEERGILELKARNAAGEGVGDE